MSCPSVAPRRSLTQASAVVSLFMLAAGALLAGCTPEPIGPCGGEVCEAGFTCVENALTGAAECVPPTEPCAPANSPCKADETCIVASDGAARCLAPNRCLAKTCPVGKKCDNSTGECSIDVNPCEGRVCRSGESCNPDSGRCEPVSRLCDSVCCDDDSVCDPATGACVQDRCQLAKYACKCGPSQVCEPVTGDCIDAPGPCGTCGSDEYCDQSRGRCVRIPAGVPTAGAVGAACRTSAQCGAAGPDGFCIQDGGLFGEMPEGMCSAPCETSTCAAGSACVDFGIKLCMDTCLADGDCRDGYACQQLVSRDSKRYCFPKGDTRGSTCTGPGCSPVGSGCAEDNDCVKGAQCNRNLPGGYCIYSGCRTAAGSVECRDAANCLCLNADQCNSSVTLGLAKCDVRRQDCRAGYTCYLALNDGVTGYCYPRNCDVDQDCRAQGDACSADGAEFATYCDAARGRCDYACTSDSQCGTGRRCDTSTGRCFQACSSIYDHCGPDAFCDAEAGRCQRKCTSDETCASGSYCDRVVGRCIERCTADAQCGGASQFCDATGRCRTRCSDHAGCGSSEYCSDEGRCALRCTASSGCAFGSFCHTDRGDPKYGQCSRDLKSVRVGAACTRPQDCAPYNAVCLGPQDGFPAAGYCAATDCTASTPCGPEAACVEVELSGGTRSLCLKRCTVGDDSTCPGALSCVDVEGTPVCRPAI